MQSLHPRQKHTVNGKQHAGSFLRMFYALHPIHFQCQVSKSHLIGQMERRLVYIPQTRPCRMTNASATSEAQTQPKATGQTESSASQLPASFQRWVGVGDGDSFRSIAALREVPTVIPGSGEVLVKMYYAGINGGCETFRARGEFLFKRGSTNTADPTSSDNTYTLGAEGCGVVVAVGPDVRKIKVGMPVAVNGGAAFSEYNIAKERMVTPVPAPTGDGVLPVGPEAAVLTLSGMTAIAALEGTAKIEEGETVVVSAAAGGTGHIAVQIALIKGCHVIAIAGSGEKADRLRSLRTFHGSLDIINYRQQDVAAELARLCPAGVDVVYEGVGGGIRQSLLRSLAPGGRLLQVGYISEYPHATGHQGPGTAAPSTGSEKRSSPSSPSQQQQQLPCEPPQLSTSDSTMQHERNSSSDISNNDIMPGPATSTSAGGNMTSSSEEWEAAIQSFPPVWQIFWGGVNMTDLPGGRKVYGKVWPSDMTLLLKCKAKLFDLHYKSGELDVWVDQSHGFKGLEYIPDAVDYMLQGGHTGKVVLQLVK